MMNSFSRALRSRDLLIGVGAQLLVIFALYVKNYATKLARRNATNRDVTAQEEPPIDHDGAPTLRELRRMYVSQRWTIEETLDQILERTMTATSNQTRECLTILEQCLDVGTPQFFHEWLDSHMLLSCADFQGVTDLALDHAQRQRMAAIAQSLGLEPNTNMGVDAIPQRVLIVECGWGGLSTFLARTYNVQVAGVSRRQEHVEAAQEWAAQSTPSGTLSFVNPSALQGEYDRIICVSLFGVVSAPPSEAFVRDHLARGGKALIHNLRFTVDQIQHMSDLQLVYQDDISVEFGTTVRCWIHNLNTAWTRGRLRGHQTSKRHWEFTLKCINRALQLDALRMEELVFAHAAAHDDDSRVRYRYSDPNVLYTNGDCKPRAL